MTALQRTDDVLGLRRSDTVLIFGATGAVGTMAVQFAKRRGARMLRLGVFCLVFAGFFGNDNIAVAAPEKCTARIEVKLTPDVPDPRDPSFLTALLANPLYTLIWVDGSGSMAVYELTGPPTDYRCEKEINLLRRAAHVMDLKVVHPDDEN